MATIFDRELTGFRYTEVLFEDTLQSIAARELGDAARWVELISYNKLVPPFIVQDPLQAKAGVLVPGALILVPAPSAETETPQPDNIFETDILLASDGDLSTAGGDLASVSGPDNLVQALRNRLATDRGELVFHQTYGASLRRLIGVVNGPTASLLASKYAGSSVEADPRVSRLIYSNATASGDSISVDVKAEAVSGRVVSFNIEA